MEEIILPSQNDNIIRTKEFNNSHLAKTLGPLIFECMEKHKNKTFSIDTKTKEEITYGEILTKCIRTALELQNRGVKPGDIICICTYNQVNDVIPYIAGIFIGAIVCCLDYSLSYQDVKHLLKQIPPKMIFTVSESKDMILNIKNDLRLHSEIILFEELIDEFLNFNPDEINFRPYKSKDVFDTSIILFSSGTTGLPKGICLSHYYFIFQALKITKDSVPTNNLTFSTLYWASSALCLIINISFGCTRLICKEFDLEILWSIIEDYKDLSIALSINQSVLFQKYVQSIRDIPNLRRLGLGGSPVTEELILNLRNSLPNTLVRQSYGCTEAGSITAFNLQIDMKLFLEKPTSCGKPIDGYWYKIVDPETEESLGPNQLGELRLKTKCQMNGYYNIDSSNAWDSDGWLKTGDLCYYDEDYCFFVIDRLKEVIKYKGWHIPPALLEGILLQHPAVKMAFVFGIPHKTDDEHAMALIVLCDNHKTVTEDELTNFVNERVDDRKKLRGGLKIIENMPQTPSGKIKRGELKKQFLSAGNIPVCT